MRISDYINHQIAHEIYRGASLAIYQDGKWQESYFGTQDGIEPVRENLIYDLASVSKVVGVGTVMIQLLASGQMSLDDSLVTYYPPFHDGRVTLRQLVTHTSGIDPFIPNRNQLSKKELIAAIDRIRVTDNKRFRYTDINFILLGFMLEAYFGESLAAIFKKRVFDPFGITHTRFGPVHGAVPTQKGAVAGIVHDPKAKVLGDDTGSAGLFSNLADLEVFVEHYLSDRVFDGLTKNVSLSCEKERAIAWDMRDGWLLHTGYTGTFILLHQIKQKAFIFLSNRTYDKDEREQWICDRDALIALMMAEED
ncbi:serine hydrolase domain-containing protein [Streptococcus sp. zg-JUN1979]|uniref:serine hydrolase domain-containing protein n=1 Tax=Streptococcus sp. zg-JUN1979 TaxID=3391450 RepID=UPI0039A594D9